MRQARACAVRSRPRLPGTSGRALSAQRGFGGFLLIALIAGMAAAAGMFTFYRTDAVHAQSERATTDVLATAKQALIGYAVARGGTSGLARPGELPCPDTDGDGYANATCETAALLIGRLPWKTLGMPEPKDGSETLWYALSTAFRSWPAASAARRINSDTRGNITVRSYTRIANCDDASCFVVSNVTNEAAAVIFSPGGAIGTQTRNNLNVANYLDSILGTNNAASSAGPFISGPPAGTFNDRLIYLTSADFMPAVEMRVGAELKELLVKYRRYSLCKCYPWADTWPHLSGIADIGQNRGTFPQEAYPELWGSGAIPDLPGWVRANDWQNFFWYAVGRQNSNHREQTCRTCSSFPMLKVTDTSKPTAVDTWVSALLIAPGAPLDGIARMQPPTGQSSRKDNVLLYFEDPANQDGAACLDVGEIGGNEGWGMLTGATTCDAYVVPTSRSMNRDRLFTVGVSSPAQCAANAQILLNTTCHLTGTQVKPECLTAVSNLDACPCLEGGRAMLEVPCRNTPNATPCSAPRVQLQQCGQ